MPMDTNKEDQVDHLIHYTLLAGVSMSAILLIVGLFIVLVRGTPHPEVVPLLRNRPKTTSVFGPPFPGEKEVISGKVLSEILRPAFMANGVGLIYLGLLLLMTTPIALGMMLVYGYVRIGWWRFAAISLLVLLLLTTGLALGAKG